jgi:hypothetical protein
MKQLILLLTLLLVFPIASVANGEDPCRNINAHATLVDEVPECEFNSMTYDYCYIQKVRGNLNGSWVSYVMWDWGVTLESLGVQTPPEAGESWYNRELEVFTTKHGMVWGDAQFVFDLRAFDSDGGPAIPTIVTGGTGMYEDAYGWITAIYTDGTLSNWRIYGRVCGPNIEE